MANQNIFQTRLRPVLPKIYQDERVFVYTPQASSTTPGVASFADSEFTVDNQAEVTLKWPMSMQIENNTVNNPLTTPARVKLNSSEFVNTNEISEITHPTTGAKYTNTKASLKLKRTEQNAFNKPSFVMIDENDFVKSEVDSEDGQDPGRYSKYKIRLNNPIEQAAMVKLNSSDFKYDDNAKIKWPYAHNPGIGTDNTDGYGLIKIKSNSEGYLKYDDGYLVFDQDKYNLDNLGIEVDYGGKNNGFTDYDNYVDENGFAKRDDDRHSKLKLTKDAIGLSRVENKAISEYTYDNFGDEFKNYFVNKFDEKTDVSDWNRKFSDWSEVESSVQNVVDKLKAKDESILDAFRSSVSFVGFYETVSELQAAYQANEWTFGASAYLNDTKSYWRVRANNVNKVIATGIPTRLDIPDEASDKKSYRVGVLDTKTVYQWNGNRFELTGESLIWMNSIVANEEDLQPYISSLVQPIANGYTIGCRENSKVYVYNSGSWIESGSMFYEWADTYIATLAWQSFGETNTDLLKPNGVASVGSSGKWVSSDHVHPTDETRLAKQVFNSTNITVSTEYNGDTDSDFKISLEDAANGGNLNIPYVRKAKSLHNWNSQTTFVDSEDNSDYYWAGSAEDFENQQERIQNGSLVVVQDDETLFETELVVAEDLEKSGITPTNLQSSSDERFVITKVGEVDQLVGKALTISEEVDSKGNKRYLIKSISDDFVQNNKIVVSNGEGGITAYNSFTNEQTIVGLNADGEITVYSDAQFVKKDETTPLMNDHLLTVRNEKVESLNSIDNTENGIIVADGFGSIKSASFASGKLLQTTFSNGGQITAEIDSDKIVQLEQSGMLNNSGILMSNGNGSVFVTAFSDGNNRLVITDGNGGFTTPNINPESLVFINNMGEVSAFPTSVDDNGKVLMVQENGAFALQRLPAQSDYLPVETMKDNVRTGTMLSFGEPSDMVEGVLYLW